MKSTIILAASVFAALLVSACASGARGTGSYEYRETPLTIDAGDHAIPAVLTEPVGRGPFPAVVMLHGYGSNKDEAGNGYKLFAPKLAAHGIASIRIDFLGYGESLADHAGFDLNVGVDETLKAATWIGSRPEIDKGRIGVMGWSKGGAIALLSAGRDSRFKSVLTWAGAADLSGVYTAEAFVVARRSGVYTATFDWRAPLVMSLRAFEVAAAVDVLDDFSASRAPVLAVNGSDDTVVPPATAERIRAASKNTASRTLIIPGADHTFNIFSGDLSVFNLLCEESIAWFQKTL
jgi:dienelactone hydrolase